MMDPVTIHRDDERTMRSFRTFLFYGAKQQWRNPLSYLIPAGILIVFLAAAVMHWKFISGVGFASFAAIIVYLLGSSALTLIAIPFKLRRIRKAIQTSPDVCTFWFDGDGLHYDSELRSHSIKWAAITGADCTDERIYTFKKRGELQDIYSPDLMGEGNFKKLRMVLEEKLEKTKKQVRGNLEVIDDI